MWQCPHCGTMNPTPEGGLEIVNGRFVRSYDAEEVFCCQTCGRYRFAKKATETD